MIKFSDYVKIQEDSSSHGFGNDAPGGTHPSGMDSRETESLISASKVAWSRYRMRLLTFFKELQDPEIDELVKKIDSEDSGDQASSAKKKMDGQQDDDDAVVVPSSDGNSGAEDGSWD